MNFRRLSQKSFNTSHVTLYLEVHDKQKHCRSFNTSHVTLYRCPNRTHSGHYGRFNTSHVTLYPMERRIAETVNKFQYISCYSLSQSLQFLRLDPVVSIHLMLLFICYSSIKIRHFVSFNTSHVTLYLACVYPTAPVITVSIHLMLLFIFLPDGYVTVTPSFQYISCYSLSVCLRSILSPMLVSIHLMLLFIRFHLWKFCCLNVFQYISCYSLSELSRIPTARINVFQYISCYSLSKYNKLTAASKDVSIHLMLLFIEIGQLRTGCGILRFNTSHVTLYPSFYRLFFF